MNSQNVKRLLELLNKPLPHDIKAMAIRSRDICHVVTDVRLDVEAAERENLWYVTIRFKNTTTYRVIYFNEDEQTARLFAVGLEEMSYVATWFLCHGEKTVDCGGAE